MHDDGDAIPVPRSYEELRHDPEFLADATGAIVTVVQPERLPAEV